MRRSGRWLRGAGAVALALAAMLCGTAHAQRLALTFDDGFDPRAQPEAAAWNAQLLGHLRRERVRAMLFPAGRRVGSADGMALVAAWSRAGHPVGNHTFSHRNLGSQRMALDAFTDDVHAADRLLRALPTATRWLRFPYLKEGDTAAKRDGMRAWVRAHGFQPAPVSIDTSDWYYDERYQALLARGRADLLPALRKAYLAHLLDRARHYDALARQVLGRSPAHVLLLHTNAINAAWAGDAIRHLRANGFTLVPPAEAFADPLYAREPQGLPAGESIVWALARDAGVDGLRYPAEDGAYEAPALDALGL